MAVQVSIDTAVQHCEVRDLVVKGCKGVEEARTGGKLHKIHLWLAIACEGGGGWGNGAEMTKILSPARYCMRRRWRMQE